MRGSDIRKVLARSASHASMWGFMIAAFSVAASVSAQAPSPVPGLLGAPEATAQASPLPTIAPTVPPVDLENDFAISVPKGLSGRISFTAKVKNADRIFVLDLDGRRVSPLIATVGNSNGGTWSPDGQELLFVSDRDGNKELYVAKWDGSGERRLTVTPSVNEDQPAWHPNGKEIVFVGEGGDVAAPASNIFSLILATGEIRQLTKLEGRNINPHWSPQGDTVTFATNRFWPGWRIVMWKPAGGPEQFVSKVEGQVVSQPVFSPDGERIYFANNTPGVNSLQMFKLADRSIASARHGDGRHIDPAPGPDDRTIAFAFAGAGSTAYTLFVVSRVDRSIQPLLSSVYSLRHPSWSGVKSIALEAAKVRAVDDIGRE